MSRLELPLRHSALYGSPIWGIGGQRRTHYYWESLTTLTRRTIELLMTTERLLFCIAIMIGVVPLGARAEWRQSDMIGQDQQGRSIVRPMPMEARFRNPVSDEDEQAFQDRARGIIAEQAKIKVPAGNTYFENEKRTYGYLMAQILADNANAIKDIQMEDAQAQEWHRDTAGIDFYACFTLKHQTRKFFYFGDLLEPAYRDRMFQGGKSWTSQDPFKRPHFTFKAGGGGWGPNERNSWVDVRSTENLYLMRVTSVYLFAEATGNKEVAAKYKDEIRRYANALYRIGMGEWDSENYHGHSLGPLCNLYDFAKDDEVRSLAKACLDWVFAAGAVKYYRGAFNGPTKRDYNHIQPFGGSAANMLSLHFGDCPQKTAEWESDEVHLITSAYRPPPAVLNLARKKFEKPVELIASKPPYTATTSGDREAQPEFAETQYFGHSFQMGSLHTGTSEDGGDVNGFKIVMFDSSRGAVALQCVPGPDPMFVGSPKYEKGKVAGPNRVAQYGNLAIWLVKNGKAPWSWVLPQSVKVSREKDVTFLEAERTWIALRPLGATPIEKSDELTMQISQGEKPAFPGHQVLISQGTSAQFCGVAVEVGEKESYQSFATFRQQVLAAEVDVAKLEEANIQYKASGTTGHWLGMNWNQQSGEVGVWRNGKRHDWKQHAKSLYRRLDREELAGPIYSRWREGTLYVEAGGEAFASTVGDDGQATFHNGKPEEVRNKVPALLKPFVTTQLIEVPGLPEGVTVSQDLRSPKPGIQSFTVEAPGYQRGPVKLEVLLPTDYAPERSYHCLYTLPVNVGTTGPWGCALEELQRRNLHNTHQLIGVAPAYDIDPWMGDMAAPPASNQPVIRQQAYITDVVVPFIEARFAKPAGQKRPDRYLIGFSKSSLGALSLFLRHPDDFEAVGVFDNAELQPSEKIFHDWGMINSYGSMDQFQKLNPRTLVPLAARQLSGTAPRLVLLTGSDDYSGVKELRSLLRQNQIPFRDQTLPGMKHDWRGDWLDTMVRMLVTKP
jgi:Putative esterase